MRTCQPNASVLSRAICFQRLADLRVRETAGHSIHDEIQAMRLEKAYSLSRNRNQATGPIANLCGYTSEPFFKKMFKRETDLTMREWRKQNVTQRA